MVKYTARVLRQRQRSDVTVIRPTRKAIFSHGLWCPRRIRERRSVKAVLMTSRQCSPSRQCIWPLSIALELSSFSSTLESSQTPPKHLTTVPPLISRSKFIISKSSHIPALAGNQSKCSNRRNRCRVSYLQPVRRTPLTPTVNVGVLLNARSVHVNSANICD